MDSFYVREGDENNTVMRFAPQIAPVSIDMHTPKTHIHQKLTLRKFHSQTHLSAGKVFRLSADTQFRRNGRCGSFRAR